MRFWPWFCQFHERVPATAIARFPLYSMSSIDSFDCNFGVMTLSVDSSSSENVGWCDKSPLTFVFQATLCYNAILCLYFHNCFFLFLRLNETKKCFFFNDVSATEFLFKWSWASSLTLMICLIVLNPKIVWRIWSVIIRNLTWMWQLNASSSLHYCRAT